VQPFGRGVHVTLAPPGEAELTLQVALAPGLVAPVGIAAFRTIAPDEAVALEPAVGCLALDGERTLELRGDERPVVRLVPGPLTIDVDAVMRRAAEHRLLA
jgi:hypothetical protein